MYDLVIFLKVVEVLCYNVKLWTLMSSSLFLHVVSGSWGAYSSGTMLRESLEKIESSKLLGGREH